MSTQTGWDRNGRLAGYSDSAPDTGPYFYAGSNLDSVVRAVTSFLDGLGADDRIEAINTLREAIHGCSPFQDEPVDRVLWVPMHQLVANDYNPNAVAPPEMHLLERSIDHDGYTQPIVAWKRDDGMYEVVDGFHRNRVGRESLLVDARIRGHLPITVINEASEDRGNRIAATIRHNRARGKHQVSAMSEIVIELKRRNWTNARISRELGMDEDEILRLCQITGLAEMFGDQEFSAAWDVVGEVTVADFEELTDELGDEDELPRTVNTSDPDRVFHRYTDWECYKAGFYATSKDGMRKADGEEAYRRFLSDDAAFRDALTGVITEWVNSCEHYLSNVAMNRIAWLGQAAACYAMGLPAVYRSGFHLLTTEEQARADNTALEALNEWLVGKDREPATMEEARSYGRQSDIY